MPEVDKILEERGKRYGDFGDNSVVAQALKDSIEQYSKNLPQVHKEALDLIFTKISRIVTGDCCYVDNWDDIAGYATLIAERLRRLGNDSTSEKA